jgi:putative ABC transport system ATP-binding protein
VTAPDPGWEHILRFPVLEVRSLRMVFAGAPPTVALDSASFDILPGESVAVVGKSGSGKSTLLNLLGLLEKPSSGSYQIGMLDTLRISERQRTTIRSHLFGFVFQAFHLLDDRSALHNVALGMLYRDVPRQERERLGALALDRVGLSHRADASPRTLSGGERQRVAIARAIAGAPRVLLCDEPTGNLDSESAQAVIGLLRSLKDEGVTLVVVTHDMTVAKALGERWLAVHDGVVRETIPSDHLTTPGGSR